MSEFPEPEGKTPGGCLWLAVGMIVYAMALCAATVAIMAHWKAGA